MIPPPPRSPLFPYTTLFRSIGALESDGALRRLEMPHYRAHQCGLAGAIAADETHHGAPRYTHRKAARSEEHTSELQSPDHLVCRLLLEKKKKKTKTKY